ncbi:MAG: hypothetical protein PHD32_00215 [Eubacteriales bacterium]|nr:hypothetical protein [Eubacteriales bacterium]
MKKIWKVAVCTLLGAAMVLSAGCNKNKAGQASAPQGEQPAPLATIWELYDPYGAWVDKMTLDAQGGLLLGDQAGKWSAKGDKLTLATDDGQTFVFTYVIDGYQMVLKNSVMGTQLTFLAPEVFVAGDNDASLVNTWMDKDGVNYIQLSTDGKYHAADVNGTYELNSVYFARDGIMRLYNQENASHEYYGYTADEDQKTLTLQEVGVTGGGEYTYYAQRAAQDFAGEWLQIASNGEGELPRKVVLNADGTGQISGGSSKDFTWSAYGGNMVIKDTNGGSLDYSFTIWGGTMYVSNEVDGAAMLVCNDHITDVDGDAEKIVGNWSNGDGTVKMTLDAQGTIKLTVPGVGGETATISGTARYGAELLMIDSGEQETYYLYQLNEDTLTLTEAASAYANVQASWTLSKQQ